MRQISNFVGSNPITVSVSNSGSGKLVHFKQDAGAMSFLHSMTPDQAILLSEYLVEAAAQLLGRAPERTALERSLKIGQALDAAFIATIKPDAYRYRYLRDAFALNAESDSDAFAELAALSGKEFDAAVDAAMEDQQAEADAA